MGRRRFRFRLSDMMPNSWFYKLRDMRRAGGHRFGGGGGGGGGGASAMQHSSSSLSYSRGTRSAPQPATPRRGPVAVALPHRASYYCTTRDREILPPRAATATEDDGHRLFPLPQSPSCSPRRRHRVGPVKIGRAMAAVVEAGPDVPQRRRDMYVGGEDVGEVRKPAMTAPSEDSLVGKVIAPDTDITFNLCAEDTAERVLRPIATRPARRPVVVGCELKERETHRQVVKERHVEHAATTPGAGSASEQGSNKPRRSSVSSGRRLKTRANSPRLVCRTGKPAPPTKTTSAPPPAPLAESFAVVKASVDPRSDFRESMVEMIAEKGIREAADLEDLLACYLALNAAEYHDLIVEVFEQIWTGLAGGHP